MYLPSQTSRDQGHSCPCSCNGVPVSPSESFSCASALVTSLSPTATFFSTHFFLVNASSVPSITINVLTRNVLMLNQEQMSNILSPYTLGCHLLFAKYPRGFHPRIYQQVCASHYVQSFYQYLFSRPHLCSVWS